MPFQKGQSGNPGGRPKESPELKAAARAHTKAAVETLAKIMKSGKFPPAARVSAAQALLDRGWGKAAQPITGEDDGALKIEIVKYAATPK